MKVLHLGRHWWDCRVDVAWRPPPTLPISPPALSLHLPLPHARSTLSPLSVPPHPATGKAATLRKHRGLQVVTCHQEPNALRENDSHRAEGPTQLKVPNQSTLPTSHPV